MKSILRFCLIVFALNSTVLAQPDYFGNDYDAKKKELEVHKKYIDVKQDKEVKKFKQVKEFENESKKIKNGEEPYIYIEESFNKQEQSVLNSEDNNL